MDFESIIASTTETITTNFLSAIPYIATVAGGLIAFSLVWKWLRRMTVGRRG